MTNPIVIAFYEDGQIEYTRNSQFMPWGGRGEMVRVTDIRKQPSGSRFFIQWLIGPHAGEPHRYETSMQYGVDFEMPNFAFTPSNLARATMYFDSYEAAVAHEVAVLNAMRREGIKFHASA